MRGLSLTQPWATLVAIDEKRIETRSWMHPYRGLVAIHAAQKVPAYAMDFCSTPECQEALHRGGVDFGGLTFKPAHDLPRGAIVAVANISTMFRFTASTRDKILSRSREGGLPRDEALFGDYSAGRCGIVLDQVRELAVPVPCRGMLSLFELPTEVERAVIQQLTEATHA